MFRRRSGQVALLAAFVLAGTPSAVRACAVCFGNPDSPLTQAANTGILVLLGFICFVLISIVAFGTLWIVRARRVIRRRPDQLTPSMFLAS